MQSCYSCIAYHNSHHMHTYISNISTHVWIVLIGYKDLSVVTTNNYKLTP